MDPASFFQNHEWPVADKQTEKYFVFSAFKQPPFLTFKYQVKDVYTVDY